MPGPFSGITRTYARLTRYRHIMAVLIKYGFEEVAGLVSTRFRVKVASAGTAASAQNEITRTSLPQRTRMALEELGPTFVKLGQLLSTRPDLVPDRFIKELELLQDRVTPEKYQRIRDQIHSNLGGWPEEIFAHFDEEPLAAASIAQVHRARTHDGREVVVKVRRSGIVKTIRTELEILFDVAKLINKRFAAPENFDAVHMIREFSQAVNKEVDFNNERLNQRRFRQLFKDDPAIHVPEILEEYCGEGILTMEFIDGIKPSQVEQLKEAGLDPAEIARRGAEFVIRQVYDYGFFHADPHPGNFLVIENNILAPLDFGQVGRLTRQDKLLLQQILMAIVNKDGARMVYALENADMLGENTNTLELTRDLEDIIDSYGDLPLKDIPFREAIGRSFDVLRRHHVRPPRDFTIMLKCLMTIESFAKKLDNNFEIFALLKPYARKLAMEEMNPASVLQHLYKTAREASGLIARLPQDTAVIINKFRRGQFKIHVHHEHLEELEQTVDNSSNRLSFAIIIAALLVGSSLLISQSGFVLGIISLQTLGVLGYLAAAVMGLWLVFSIIRSRKY